VKLLGGLALLLGFLYVFWTGGMAVRSYWQMSDVVDRAFELQERARAGAAAVRRVIVEGAAEAGVPIAADDVEVTEDGGVLAVRLHWSWPVVSWQGEHIVRVPLSLERTKSSP
jgi:hypothetical protein